MPGPTSAARGTTRIIGRSLSKSFFPEKRPQSAVMEKIAMLSRAPFASSTTAVGLLRPLEVHAATAGPDRAKRQLMFGNGNLCSSPEPQLVHEAPQICALLLPQLSTTSALTCRH